MNITDQIKQIDLISIVGSVGVELQQRGKKYVGLCPLHEETEPSFFVYPDNHWWCFGGCGGGDAVDFLRLRFGYDFPEALKHLGINCRRTNEKRIEIERKKKIEAARIQRERDIVHTLSVLIRSAKRRGCFVHLLPAWEWYHETIYTGSKEEKAAIINGLKSWPTISRNYLFRPDFSYRGWMRDFINKEPTIGNERKTRFN